MNTTDKIMALANTYASSNGKALLEKLYGTSQSYTEQCAAEAFKDREALREAIEALVRDAERYRWLCSYTIIPAPSLWDNGVGFVTPALPRKSGAMNKQELDTAIDAMQEKQS